MYINNSELLKTLSYWYDKTDDDCIKLASNKYVINAETALSNIANRDFCKSVSNGIINKLEKLSKNET